jgi:2-desacetyl-2-hydroxyethyl bacteriochlorophyllide A dehydrogenase
MQALWLENGRLKIREKVPVPRPSAGQALVRVLRAGICGTDLELMRGYYPFTGIPGHEFVGEIVEAPGAPARIGERVVGEINVACGQCRQCLSGAERHCENRRVMGIKGLNGAFATYVCLPLRNLLTLPRSISDRAAIFVEPLAAALRVQAQVRIRPSDRVLVMGAGRLGQLIARTLHLLGCDLTATPRYRLQRQLLEDHGIRCLETDRIPPRSFEVVVEATGSPEGFFSALEAVVPRGAVILKSTYNNILQLDVSGWVVNEIRLIGSRCGPFGPALELLDHGQIDPTDLIEAHYPLKNGREAFRHASRAGCLKVVLQMD